jgi:pentose-5-phosphate-3-epimerase
LKLSASLYSSKQSSLLDAAKELEAYGVDFWHIDSIENFSVFEDISALGLASETLIDLHIITKQPLNYYPHLGLKNIKRISFQIENLDADFSFPKLKDKQIGLAIQIHHPNPFETVKRYMHQVDFVLLMMTTPGISGGKFDQSHFNTIRQLVREFPNIEWCVDGGVNHEIAYILRLIGVQSVVIGSYLLNHTNMAQAIMQIRSHHVRSEYHVLDFCIPWEHLPIISEDADVKAMLTTMHAFQLGIVFCLDSEARLIGIISNADVRRVLIEGNFSYDLAISSFLNAEPKFISDQSSTSDMIEYISKISFPILVLPVLSDDRKLKGAVSFHKLLKEE